MHSSHTRVAIIGAGFSGIGMGARLRRHGVNDFVVLERGDDVGGAWFANRYPGAGCDSPSRTYCLSFAPNPDWSRTFARQPEIQAYLRGVAAREGVLARTQLRCEVRRAAWNAEEQRWHLDTSRGPRTADVLVAGTGTLSEPKIPAIAGIETFAGRVAHTAKWPDDLDVRGQRVAVVGTGASAAQLIPELRRTAAWVDVYQRSAPWVLPRLDRPTLRVERRLYRAFPRLDGVLRDAIILAREVFVPGFAQPGLATRIAERAAVLYRRVSVRDPELRRQLSPDYRMGCKRILLSNTYYAALAASNVRVVSDIIRTISPSGPVTNMGDIRPVDMLIFATGFATSPHPMWQRIVNAEGTSLADRWKPDGASAFRGTTVAGFPNLFLLYGPNTGQGHNTITYMLESQFTYVLGALDQLERAPGIALSPNTAVQRAHNRWLQTALQGSVWSSGGCHSWYLDADGRNTTLWPTYIRRFRRQLARFDVENYDAHPSSGATDLPFTPPSMSRETR